MAERRGRAALRALVAVAVVVALAALGLLGGTLGGPDDPAAGPPPGPTASASSSGGGPGSAPRDQEQVGTDVDPQTGLPWVPVEQLPPEAGEVLALIDAGGPFRYEADGRTFNNFEGLLPERPRGWYREYTVPTPGEDDRGARRIVTGDDDTLFFWTEDHYASFARIQR
ncbi:ribonuclease domain-containing protein [Auraticoccus cholistanensis]|uniref:ribonuclease domain-containing protein n=1 Tax=Auraticoccus cholistanensis TaxID=2656650 RepID=UPI002F911770